MNKEIIFELLQQALVMFYNKEQRNLELDVHEICHAHRLAIYLEQQIQEYDKTCYSKPFKDYSVDIEFNRTENGMVKKLEGDNIRCDILVHSKGANKDRENLLIVELKKENRDEEQDRTRVQRMVSPDSDNSNNPIYDTLLGVVLKIGRTNNYSGTKYWYEDGIKEEDFKS